MDQESSVTCLYVHESTNAKGRKEEKYYILRSPDLIAQAGNNKLYEVSAQEIYILVQDLDLRYRIWKIIRSSKREMSDMILQLYHLYCQVFKKWKCGPELFK